MQKCQWNSEDIKKYGALTKQQMESRAKVPGLLALVSTTTDGNQRIEFVNRDFNAAINIERCVLMIKRPPELMRASFVGQPLKVISYKQKTKSAAGAWSK